VSVEVLAVSCRQEVSEYVESAEVQRNVVGVMLSST
jgi:hypothetical protein